jgi:hypothetical protein
MHYGCDRLRAVSKDPLVLAASTTGVMYDCCVFQKSITALKIEPRVSSNAAHLKQCAGEISHARFFSSYLPTLELA